MNNYRGPGVYRHYKGGLYRAIGLGVREETVMTIDDEVSDYPRPVIVVVYRPLSEGSLLGRNPFENVEYWTRELEDFDAEVTVTEDADKGLTNKMARFTFVRGF